MYYFSLLFRGYGSASMASRWANKPPEKACFCAGNTEIGKAEQAEP